MSVAAIVTRGFHGGIRFIPTRGYSAGSPAPIPVVDTHDGANEYYYKHHLDRYLKNQEELSALRKRYEDVRQIDDGILLNAIEEFIEPDGNEGAILAKAPPIEKVDLLGIIENKLAITQLEYAIEKLIQRQQLINQIRRDEEDMFFMLCISAK